MGFSVSTPIASNEPSRMDLSVILINWNALDMTANALTSLKLQTSGISYEVFVVDNGTSKDASIAELPVRFPWANFLFNHENLGFTKATNQGIRQATGRYILLLNNDTIQTENALGKAVGYLDEHLDVGALGILHLNNDNEKSFQLSYYSFPKLLDRMLGMLKLNHRSPSFEIVERDVDWVCGSFLMIRRPCLEQVGLLDERFFAYHEDVDWCMEAKKAGWLVRYWPGTSMIHLGSGAAGQLRDKTGLMYRSELLYFNKQVCWVAAAFYYALTSMVLAGSVVKQCARWLTGRGRRDEIWHRWRRLIQFATLRRTKAGS